MLSVEAWLYILVLAVFASIVGGMMFFYGLRKIEAERASAIAASMPLFTILFSALLLSQAILMNQIIGALIIISGILTLSKSQEITWTVRHSLALAKKTEAGFIKRILRAFLDRFKRPSTF